MPNGDSFTVKEIVLEIREDVKDLREKIDTIDRQGSIGTREELTDHEHRIRFIEKWAWTIPPTIITSLGSVATLIILNH